MNEQTPYFLNHAEARDILFCGKAVDLIQTLDKNESLQQLQDKYIVSFRQTAIDGDIIPRALSLYLESYKRELSSRLHQLVFVDQKLDIYLTVFTF